MPVELRQLRFIVAAANHRSFRHAAASLRVKQSTLSRAIRVVEERLNVRLFDRSNGGAKLTPAGVTFVQGAELVVQTVSDIVTGAKAASRGESGRLAIGSHSAHSAWHLHAMLAAFRETFTGVEIAMSEGSGSRLVAQLGAGAIDVAILCGEPSGSELCSVPAWSERIVAVLPDGHPLAARNALHWTDLAGEVLLASRSDPGPEIEAVLASKLGSPEMQPTIMWHDVAHATLPQLAGLGLGVALVCESSIEPRPGIQVRDIRDGSGASGIFYVAAYRRGDRNPMLARFLRLLRERYPSGRMPCLAAE